MKIKTTKQMRLDELIKYVWENDIKDKAFSSNFPEETHRNKLYVHPDGSITIGLSGGNRVDNSLLYTVSIESDLTEETELRGVTTFIEKNETIFPVYAASASIDECLDSLSDTNSEPLKMFKGITEIWSKDTGIPSEGTLEL